MILLPVALQVGSWGMTHLPCHGEPLLFWVKSVLGSKHESVSLVIAVKDRKDLANLFFLE